MTRQIERARVARHCVASRLRVSRGRTAGFSTVSAAKSASPEGRPQGRTPAIAPELLLRHGGGDALAIVDDVVGAVVADECDLVIDARGGNDVRAARLRGAGRRIPTPRHGDVENGPDQPSCSGVSSVAYRRSGRGRSAPPATTLRRARTHLQDGSRRLRSEKWRLVRAPTMLHSTIWPRLSTLLSPLEWRGGRREDPVVGVRFVARGEGDQGRFCEGSAHEFEADREAIRGEASRYNHGG
jgi:hypothetical protein